MVECLLKVCSKILRAVSNFIHHKQQRYSVRYKTKKQIKDFAVFRLTIMLALFVELKYVQYYVVIDILEWLYMLKTSITADEISPQVTKAPIICTESRPAIYTLNFGLFM